MELTRVNQPCGCSRRRPVPLCDTIHCPRPYEDVRCFVSDPKISISFKFLEQTMHLPLHFSSSLKSQVCAFLPFSLRTPTSRWWSWKASPLTSRRVSTSSPNASAFSTGSVCAPPSSFGFCASPWTPYHRQRKPFLWLLGRLDLVSSSSDRKPSYFCSSEGLSRIGCYVLGPYSSSGPSSVKGIDSGACLDR